MPVGSQLCEVFQPLRSHTMLIALVLFFLSGSTYLLFQVMVGNNAKGLRLLVRTRGRRRGCLNYLLNNLQENWLIGKFTYRAALVHKTVKQLCLLQHLLLSIPNRLVGYKRVACSIHRTVR